MKLNPWDNSQLEHQISELADANSQLEARESELTERNSELQQYASYQETLTNLVISQAQGNLLSRAEQTAAVEFGAGLLERCFMVADITPESLSRVTLTPIVVSRMVRQTILTGNSVNLIDVADGQLQLLPAANYNIRGGHRERSWRYRMELSGPSSTTVRRSTSDGVVHVRIGSSVQEPWRGYSPLLNAGLSSTLLGRIEKKMALEANMKVGAVIPFPEESDTSELKRDLATEGKISFVPTTAGGHGAGMRASPREDWEQKRLGAHFPESNIALRSDSRRRYDIIAALWAFQVTRCTEVRTAYRRAKRIAFYL